MFSGWQKSLNEAYKTASTAAKDLGSHVLGAKLLRDYTLGPQTSRGGLGGCWQIFSGRSKKEGAAAEVSIWVASKQALDEGGVQHARREAQALARVKHPAVLKVVEGLEETRHQLLFITEPCFGSLQDVLDGFASLPGPAPGARGRLQLSPLEQKAGLLQVVEGLAFLHAECQLVHRAVCPVNILVTLAGAWKLAGLGCSCPSFLTAETPVHSFVYDPPPRGARRFTQPELAYVAPELATPSATPQKATAASDAFSLGLVAYEVLAGRRLLRSVGTDLSEYQGLLAALPTMPLDGAPVELQPTLRAFLSASPSLRPPILAFSAASYFQEDTLLRAVQFLDSFLQRENLQKAAFLKDFALIWSRLDDRVLKLRVLPALLGEARNAALQGLLLPLLCKVAERLDDQALAELVLPGLAPALQAATGHSLLLCLKAAPAWAARCPKPVVAAHLVPLIRRALESGEPQVQEEGLLATLAVAPRSDVSAVEAELVPRVHACCLGTTSAAVRTAALEALHVLAQSLPKSHIAPVLDTIRKVTAVDKTANTAEGCLKLGAMLARLWGPEVTAEGVLPVLTPLLVLASLTPPQFAAALKTVRDLLELVASSRGVSAGALTTAARTVSHSSLPAAHSPGQASPAGLGSPASSAAPSAPPNNLGLGLPAPAPHRLARTSQGSHESGASGQAGPRPAASWQPASAPEANTDAGGWSSFEGGDVGAFASPGMLTQSPGDSFAALAQPPPGPALSASGPLPASGVRIDLRAGRPASGAARAPMRLGGSQQHRQQQQQQPPTSLI